MNGVLHTNKRFGNQKNRFFISHKNVFKIEINNGPIIY